MVSRSATRESFSTVPETCPAIDIALANITAAIEDADEQIKKQTAALRDALNEAIERALQAEERITKLESEIDDLLSTISDLKKEVECAQGY